MSKKDYILLARVIKSNATEWKAESLPARAISKLAYELAKTLKLENPRFDVERFISACMPE